MLNPDEGTPVCLKRVLNFSIIDNTDGGIVCESLSAMTTGRLPALMLLVDAFIKN